MSDEPPPDGCKRCGGLKEDWQIYCGAACCALWEMGDRDPEAPGSFERRIKEKP